MAGNRFLLRLTDGNAHPTIERRIAATDLDSLCRERGGDFLIGAGVELSVPQSIARPGERQRVKGFQHQRQVNLALGDINRHNQ